MQFVDPKLNSKFIEEINARIKSRVGYAVDEAIRNEIRESQPEKALKEAFNAKVVQIQKYDFDKVASEYIKKRVGQVLSKMVAEPA